MESSQYLKSNISGNNKVIKIEYNKNQKQSNYFRGENINTNKFPKKLSYDKTEIFYTSRIKDEIEPKLLLEKLPEPFHFKNNQKSNDSKTTTQTKTSTNEQKNNYYKLSINNSNETSPEAKDINTYKSKKRSEERKKINNFFNEEELNIQKQLQMKRNHTHNNKTNNELIPLKIITKTNNDFLDVKKSSTDYNKNVFIYNNSNNNHLQTDLSEYENLRPKNNLIDLGYKSDPSKNNLIKNFAFNTSAGEKFKNSQKILKENTFNLYNKKNNYIYNEELNISDLNKYNYRKSSDSDIYPTQIKYINNSKKKNERSGSCMNMVNYQNFILPEKYYSPNATNTNINTIQNNKTSNDTMKENDKLRLSAKPLLHPIIPHRKNSNDEQTIKPSKYLDKNIKILGKIAIMSFLNEINLNEKIKKQRKEIENINEGITFKLKNGFKYYFNLRNINIYFLKEIQFSLSKGVSTAISSWNKKFKDNINYLNIVCRLLNTPENHYTIVIEYPKGGESLYDIVNSIGLNDQKLIYYIISEINKNISLLKKEDNVVIKEYQNIPFCLCNLFLTISEEIKIMPPIIRKIPINASKIFNNNKNKKENILCNSCQCKKNFEILMNQINLPTNNISYFCLGLCILQIITQNFLFKLKSYKILIKNKDYFECCLIHSLLNIEKKIYNNRDLLLTNFLPQYDNKLFNFIEHCTKFTELKNCPDSDFCDYHFNIDKKLDLSMRELLKIMILDNNNYISLNNFLKNFKLLFNDMKIDKNNFKSLLHKNKIIDIIKRSFNIDKKELKNKIYKIIDNSNDNDYIDDFYNTNEYYQNENFANSGNYFYNPSSLKKLENENKKIMTIINDNANNENKKSCFNKNHIIFKNYNSDEDNRNNS